MLDFKDIIQINKENQDEENNRSLQTNWRRAFEKAGYDRSYAKVTLSNRPDLCEYQCNGAMAGAKAYKKAPIMIAEAAKAENLKDSRCIEEVNGKARIY